MRAMWMESRLAKSHRWMERKSGTVASSLYGGLRLCTSCLIQSSIDWLEAQKVALKRICATWWIAAITVCSLHGQQAQFAESIPEQTDCVPEIVVLPSTELEIEFVPALPDKVQLSTVNGVFLTRAEGSGEIRSIVWRADDSYGEDYILIASESSELYLRIEVSVVSPEDFSQASPLEMLPDDFQQVLGRRYIIPTSWAASLGDVLVLTKSESKARKRPRCGPGSPPPKPKRCRGNRWSMDGPPERVSVTRRTVGSGNTSQEVRVCGQAALELAKKLRRLGISFNLDVNGCLTTTISGTAWLNVEQTSKYRFIRDTYCCRNGVPVLCNRRVCYQTVRQYYLVFPALGLEIPVGPPHPDPPYCP